MYVSRGDHVCLPSLQMYVAVAFAVRRNAVFSVPSGFSTSLWRMVIFCPRFPVTVRRTTPAKFCPKS